MSSTLSLEIPSFGNGAVIPGKYAFCIPDTETIIALGPNRNPHVRWSGAPKGTQSLTLLVHDPDVPSVGDDVNQEGKTVPADLPRVDFFHWVLTDIPASLSEIEEGGDSDGVTARGKSLLTTEIGTRGRNDYTAWFEGDEQMEGIYAGYDGPCPPWNDELLHHYHFTLYALDVASLDLSGNFGGPDVLKAMEGHILDQAEWVGIYSFNPDLY